MYAMDQTMHFEHSVDAQRHSRWDLHRRGGRSSSTGAINDAAVATAISDADVDPTHKFLD